MWLRQIVQRAEAFQSKLFGVVQGLSEKAQERAERFQHEKLKGATTPEILLVGLSGFFIILSAYYYFTRCNYNCKGQYNNAILALQGAGLYYLIFRLIQETKE